MSAEEDEQLGLESIEFISDITMKVNVTTVKDDLQLLHIQDHNNSASNNCFTFSSFPQQDDSSKDVNKNISSSECEAAKKEEDEEEHKLNPVKKKLVSALKGSRAKEGKNSVKGKELSVTWAPDVYDPLPSAAQTFTKIKKPRPKKKKKLHEDYKKNGKYNKQRAKVDKGGSSSKNKNKSTKPIQKQGGDDVRMWWQQDTLEEIYDDDSFATGIRIETEIL